MKQAHDVSFLVLWTKDIRFNLFKIDEIVQKCVKFMFFTPVFCWRHKLHKEGWDFRGAALTGFAVSLNLAFKAIKL